MMSAHFGQAEFFFNGARLIADPDGVLYLPDSQTLIVADLHLEKGSSFARRGAILPPYDTQTTLMRLESVVARLQPRLIVALGDSFHDGEGPDRLSPQDARRLSQLQAGREWIWILGNHDDDLHPAAKGARAYEIHIARLVLRHAPEANSAPGEIFGHFHPVAVLGGRRRAFVTDGARLLMPAFGAYAGGLNLHAPPIKSLFSRRRFAYVLGRDAQGHPCVYPVCASRCRQGR